MCIIILSKSMRITCSNIEPILNSNYDGRGLIILFRIEVSNHAATMHGVEKDQSVPLGFFVWLYIAEN